LGSRYSTTPKKTASANPPSKKNIPNSKFIEKSMAHLPTRMAVDQPPNLRMAAIMQVKARSPRMVHCRTILTILPVLLLDVASGVAICSLIQGLLTGLSVSAAGEI